MKLPQPKEYDIACPDCRSIENISVAGTTDYPRNPKEWFCYCRACKKSYSPRKKEESELSPFEALPVEGSKKDQLTKEKYLELKEKGWTDSIIRKEYGFRSSSEFNKLKDKWNLIGKLPKVKTASEGNTPIEPKPVPVSEEEQVIIPEWPSAGMRSRRRLPSILYVPIYRICVENMEIWRQ